MNTLAFVALLFVAWTFGEAYANFRRDERSIGRRSDVDVEVRRTEIRRESTNRDEIRRIDELQRRLDKRLFEQVRDSRRDDYRESMRDDYRKSRRDDYRESRNDIRDERRRQSRYETSNRRLASFNESDLENLQSGPFSLKFGMSIAAMAILLFQFFSWKSSDKLE